MFLAASLLLGSPAIGANSSPDIYAAPYWVIDETPSAITWIEIHNAPEAAKTGIAHICVLSKRKSAPAWEFQWVCDHMAITTDALKRSVLRPYKIKSGAYPAEHYDPAYARWAAQETVGGAPICSTTIADYLKMHLSPHDP